MREVQRASDQGDSRATLALNMYARSVAKQIAGMYVVLGGIDLLVFTGGVGEHADALRERITHLLQPLRISPNFRVLPSQENERIAYHSIRLLDAA